jgi:hypothetical protein
LTPRGEVVPLGVKFSVRPSILLNSRDCSPLGVNEGVNIPPWGQIPPLGARGEVTNGPLAWTTITVNPCISRLAVLLPSGSQ